MHALCILEGVIICRLEMPVRILCWDLIKMLLEHFVKLIMDIPLGVLMCQWTEVRCLQTRLHFASQSILRLWPNRLDGLMEKPITLWH